MLTRRGWFVAASTPALLFAGRLLGLRELYVLAIGALVLCAVALASVRSGAVVVRTDRTLHPPRVYAGTSSRVDLEIRNSGTRRTPVLAVRDPFDRGWRWARFLVPPLPPGTSSRAAYRLPTGERGIFDVGPLEVARTDPFGLASAVSTTAGMAQLTVYPTVHDIAPMPASQGHDPHSGAQHPRALLGAGEDFYALRPYQVGDDLRRVHWASTARVDDLMIRQDEVPWQTRSTILLDVRAKVHTAASLELAVTAAASIHAATRDRQSLVRLLSTDGTDSGFGSGHAHNQAILEHLATVGGSRDERFAGVAGSLRRAGNGGSLAIVTTDRAPTADLELLARLRSRYGTIVLVVFERSSYETGRPLPPAKVPVVTAVVPVTAEVAFPAAWDQAVAAVEARR